MNFFHKLSSGTSQRARRAATREADLARDRGDALQAAILYEAVIKRWGPTFGLLVQYGNALKDSGAFKRAEETYQSALKMKPNDADCFLQLGHLMKLAGHPHRAEHFYREAGRMDPTSGDILVELHTIEAQREAEAQQASQPSLEPAALAAIATEPQWAWVKTETVDRGSRSLIIRQRIMNELARRRN